MVRTNSEGMVILSLNQEWYDQHELDSQPKQLELGLDDTRNSHSLSPNRKFSFDPETIQEIYEVLQQGRMLIV